MLINPQAWFIPPSRRYFPRELVERYEDENTLLQEILEMWEWKHDLVHHGRFGPETDHAKVADQLMSEAREYMDEVERERKGD